MDARKLLEKTGYSAKLVYKNFWYYYFGILLNIRITGVIFLVVFAVSCLIAALKLLVENFKGNQQFLTDNTLVGLTAIYFLIAAGLFLLISLSAGLAVWKQYFVIENGQLIDFFPVKKRFNIQDIDRIILAKPRLAHLICKKKGDSLFTVLYWHGSSEKYWIDFLNLLTSLDKSVETKIFVNASRWGTVKEVKSTVGSSYSEILKYSK